MSRVDKNRKQRTLSKINEIAPWNFQCPYSRWHDWNSIRHTPAHTMMMWTSMNKKLKIRRWWFYIRHISNNKTSVECKFSLTLWLIPCSVLWKFLRNSRFSMLCAVSSTMDTEKLESTSRECWLHRLHIKKYVYYSRKSCSALLSCWKSFHTLNDRTMQSEEKSVRKQWFMAKSISVLNLILRMSEMWWVGKEEKNMRVFLINKDDDDSLYFMYALCNKLTNHSHFPPAIYRFNLTTEWNSYQILYRHSTGRPSVCGAQTCSGDIRPHRRVPCPSWKLNCHRNCPRQIREYGAARKYRPSFAGPNVNLISPNWSLTCSRWMAKHFACSRRTTWPNAVLALAISFTMYYSCSYATHRCFIVTCRAVPSRRPAATRCRHSAIRRHQTGPR